MEKEHDFTDIRERVIWIINEWTPIRSRYPYLEQKTGIKARKWQNVCNRAQQPTVEMLSALAEARPYFMSWMLLGDAYKRMQYDPTKPGYEEKMNKEMFGEGFPTQHIEGVGLSEEEIEEAAAEFLKLIRKRQNKR